MDSLSVDRTERLGRSAPRASAQQAGDAGLAQSGPGRLADSGTFSGTAFSQSSRFLRAVMLVVLQALLVCTLVGGGYFLWPWLRSTFDRPIARVVVRGDLVALDRQAVMDAVAIYEGDTFLNIDLPALVDHIETQPWVAHARARRRWPDTVEIDITEQQPIAYWGDKAMVNAKGRVFEHRGLYQNHNLPRLWSEVSLPAEAMNHYQIFERQLEPVGLSLHSLSQNLQGDWKLQLNNGLQVMLDHADPSGNARNFVNIYQQILANSQRPAVVVDMRYHHGAAIRWATGQ